MSEETAKLLIEAMNRLAEALAKSGNQVSYHYHYQSPPMQPLPYYTNPPIWVYGNTTYSEVGSIS